MDDQRLRDAARLHVARPLLRADVQRKQASVHAAFRESGDLKPEAIRRALPPLMLTWYLPGTVTAGANVGAEIPIAGAIRLTHLSVSAKTAPTTAACTVRLTANGTEVQTASMPPGQMAGVSAITGNAVQGAGTVLRLDVVTTGGAQNISVVASYTVPDE